MQSMTLKVLDAQGKVRAESTGKNAVSLVYANEYCEGDTITLTSDAPCGYYVIQLEDTLAPALVYKTQQALVYRIPFGEERVVFSPKAFTGALHLLCARIATEQEIAARQNLAFNPFDRHGENGFYPHSSANVETRGEAVFAAYNAIDGIYENASHGVWPYQSWGINRDPNAAWKLEFGRPVTLDELRITLRADFPHDSWWTQATVDFSDGSSEVLSLQKSAAPQSFAIAPRTVTSLLLHSLIKADDESPFPALTQFEAWGVNG